MVTTIHTLNTGWLIFPGFLSESEMLQLGRTHYILNVSNENVLARSKTTGID
jgi:hypothetical protein